MSRKERTRTFKNQIKNDYFEKLQKYINTDFENRKIAFWRYQELDLNLIKKKTLESWDSFSPRIGEQNLSFHPNLSLDWILNFPEYPWKWSYLSLNYPILEWIIQYPKYPWSWDNIYLGGDYTLEFIKSNYEVIAEISKMKLIKIPSGFTIDWFEKFHKIQWEIDMLVYHPHLELSWIQKYPDLNWHWKEISRNPNLDITWIQEYPDASWDWYDICCNPNFQIEWLELYPEGNWHFRYISWNDNLKLKWIQKYLNEKWYWEKIVDNPNLTEDWIQWIPNTYRQKWLYLSGNKNFKLEWVERFPDAIWCWNDISKSKKLDISWVKQYLHKAWSWYNINLNVNFSPEWVMTFPEIQWDFNILKFKKNIDPRWKDLVSKEEWLKITIFQNPELALELLEKNSKLDINILYVNFSDKKYCHDKCREYMAAYKIQQWWHKLKLNPRTLIGKKYMNYLYNQNF